jgi:four helix bundle protein
MADTKSTKRYFDHEGLKVYQDSVAFVAWSTEFIAERSVTGPMRNQLERAASSIPLNIAEGNGKSYSRDRCRYLESARGSALECAACLDVIAVSLAIPQPRINAGKERLREVVAMLTGLIRAVGERTAEEEQGYDCGKGPTAETE